MSDKPQARKRQPEYVRQQLLSSAARLAVEKGPASVTVSAVAEAAGVTKGGFFHHFPSKQALVEGLFDEVIRQLDHDIDQFIAVDSLDYGCFSRAYIRTVFLDSHTENSWAVLSFTLGSDTQLTRKWDSWLANRLEQHQHTDSDPQLEVARLASDGLWFSSLLHRVRTTELFPHMEQRLVAMTLTAAG
ncbi:TetR/AcrR family transcriptional regulator [Winslowiella iniecta]|uniref:TetR family transcriptional regulator n=1 Tax=Winslowiella iniecta TaxID=1560201 RepID=A0A0L7TGI3_9GAMM|nr:TetR/AcrR family transcriptional regulator [Winslowiella iniecta]KOC91584.1 TetR family transcriptional regulator [Winslowiella iniecta]KOC94464.1 TetR family transcriptional regulator [Winslowiella iniecta]